MTQPYNNLEAAPGLATPLAEAEAGLLVDHVESQPLEEISFINRLRDLRDTAGRHALHLSMTVAAAGAWAFEVSPANEAFRADAAVEVYERLQNVPLNAIAAGVAVGGITMAVESATGLATAKTIEAKEGFLGRFNRWLIKNVDDLEMTDEEGYQKSDYVLGLAGGSTPVVIAHHRRRGGRTYEENRNTALQASAGIAAFSAGLTTTAIDTIEWAAENGFPEQAMAVFDGLENWKTWVGMFAVLKASEQAKKLKDYYADLFSQDTADTLSAVEKIDEPKIEPKLETRADKIKKYAKVAGVAGFIAVGGPAEVLDLADNFRATHDIMGYIADDDTIPGTIADKAEDVTSVLWDWRIYAGGFAAFWSGNRIAQFLKNRKNQQTEA